jgi:N-acetyl sugar amidotransferase
MSEQEKNTKEEKKIKVLVNASILFVCGGIQIGISFIEHSYYKKPDNIEFYYLASKPIFDNLSDEIKNNVQIELIEVSPSNIFHGFGIRRRITEIERKFKPDLVYSIGFPSFVKFESPEVGRYTNGWEISNSKLPWNILTTKQKVKVKLRNKLKNFWAKRAIYYETQTQAAKLGIIGKLNISGDKVKVIPNSANHIFIHANASENLFDSKNPFEIFCLSAPHKHKNLNIIPKVAYHLKTKHQANCKFVLTISENSEIYKQIIIDAENLGVRNMIVNAGVLNMKECLPWYSKSNMVFLPTLLEVFSATYLEAMAMKRPIVTTNLDFARDVCSDAALFYEPYSAEDAAEKIFELASSQTLQKELIEKGSAKLKTYPNPDEKHKLVFNWLYELAINIQNNTRPYAICAKTIMDTSDPNIVFDKDGISDYYHNYQNNILPTWDTDKVGYSELMKIAEKIKKERTNKEYDCIIGLSGGLDSSYTAYIAKEVMGLRPLLFHVDAGWNTEQAVSNIEKLCNGLGLELFTNVINWQEMKDLQVAFLKSQIPGQDAPQDIAFFSGLYQFARKNKIKYVITGSNYSTECCREPQEWGAYPGIDKTMVLDIHKKFGKRELNTFPIVDILRYKIYYQRILGMTVVKPLNNVPYLKHEAEKLLNEKFGWEKFQHKHHESRFTRFYEDYWLPRKFGFEKRRAHFSSLILTGQMTREEALKRISQPELDEQTLKNEFEYVAHKLDLTVNELQQIFEGENKTFKDYKNKRHIIGLGTKILTILGLENRLFR